MRLWESLKYSLEVYKAYISLSYRYSQSQNFKQNRTWGVNIYNMWKHHREFHVSANDLLTVQGW
jgi:hypothetical protein